jgi:hypothetical protein
MENKKTLSYLNSKTWYRFLKVIYCAVFLIIVIIVMLMVWSGYNVKEVDYKNSIIICTPNDTSVSNQPHIQIPLDQIESEASYYDLLALQYGGDDLTSLNNKFRDACMINIVTMKDGTNNLVASGQRVTLNQNQILKINDQPFSPVNLEQQIYTMQELLAQTSNISPLKLNLSAFKLVGKNYSLSIVKTNNLLQTIFYFLIWFFVVIFIFEILRRAFYYIVLGSIKPSK